MDNRNEGLQARASKPYLTYLVVIYSTCLLMANILANTMIALGPFTVSAGSLTFPFTFVIASVIGEIYGYKWARRAAWTAVSMNVLMSLLIILAINLPAPEWHDRTHFELALQNTWRIVLGSITAFTAGKWINDNIHAFLKKRHTEKGGKPLQNFIFRALGSSLVGQTIDSAIFFGIAFAGIIDIPTLGGMILVTTLLQLGYEVAVSPATVKITRWIYNKENS
ncbi:MAG: queuosine precursor transporter [Spirochaetes bacterium]|nr:queuosine precursor transporter [Spirochaetota bacterium]